MDKRESEAREVLARYTVGMCLAESEKQGLALAMLEFANRTAADLEAALRDPTTVHVNMLRGGIAKPTPANIWHLYGDDALIAAMPVAAREKVARSLDLSALSCAGEEK